jgi:adenosylcobinamide kinase/adenosylcobinamide-phosphate guanylyltransferase
MQTFPNLTLVTGGAASGKSRWAEKLVKHSDRDQVYIATAQAYDAEMAAKIAQHKSDRGPNWRTIESPLELGATLGANSGSEVILVECLTMWLSNHLMAGNQVSDQVDGLLAQLAKIKSPVVLVTNEVGASVVPDNPLARRFQREQGHLNQRIAEAADLVVAVISGLPLPLKGSIPAGLT